MYWSSLTPVPKERKVTIGPRLLQQFPKSSPQREIGLELLKSGRVATGGRCHSVAEAHSTPFRKGFAGRCRWNITNVSFTVPCFCISSRCNTTLPRSQTCMNEPCRLFNPCPPRERDEPETKEIIADVLAWISSVGETRHSLDQSKCLSSVLRVRATRTTTLQTRWEKPGAKVRSTLHNFCQLDFAPARGSDPKKRKVRSSLSPHNFRFFFCFFFGGGIVFECFVSFFFTTAHAHAPTCAAERVLLFYFTCFLCVFLSFQKLKSLKLNKFKK